MLDAIAEIDNLGLEDSTLAADASPTSLDPNAALSESQGSSVQESDFNQSLMDVLSSLDAQANTTNPSLQIVSGQSVEDALADAIPGLDPTTITPPDLLAEDSSLNPFMVAALSELDNAESLGEAFQTVSDGFEDLSNSFEQLAASFLAQDSDFDTDFDTVAIDANGDDVSADSEVKNIAADDASNDTDTNFDADQEAIANVSGDDADNHSHTDSDDHGHTDSDDHGHTDADTDSEKVAIADDTDTTNADFGIGNLISNNDDTALGADFDLDFDALKVNVDQVSRGLQFLVQQLEEAFGNDSALTTETLTSVTRQA